MKIINENQRKLCDIQGKIFEESKDFSDSSSPVFVKHFMYSEIAKSLDKGDYFIESDDIDKRVNELLINEKKYGKKKYSYDELYWIGYIYRYMQIVLEISSNKLIKLVKPDYLRKMYYIYHTLDPLKAIDKICEDNNISLENEIEKGIKIYRLILNS